MTPAWVGANPQGWGWSIVRRYHTAGVPIIFELLNEVVLPESAPWNALAHQTVAALRQISPNCKIMIGGNHYNAPSELKNIARLSDPNVLYTFHFYEPFLFTHQKAAWTQVTREYDQTLTYPGAFTGLEDFLRRAPQHRDGYAWLVERPLDRALTLELFQPVRDFIAKSGVVPYCVENGAILKVIFETDYLKDEHIITLCQICSELKVAFVKTSTGYGFVKQPSGDYNYLGATEHNLTLMRQHSAPGVQIKASGGVRTLDQLLRVRALGCTRCGATATEAMLEEAKAREYA
ncbi:MAG: cellulase family glycosylhydrolase [Anaerolineales bacterium]